MLALRRRLASSGVGVASAIFLLSSPLPAQTLDPAPTISPNPAPTAEELAALLSRLAENQHRNDRALEEFERLERVMSHKGDEKSQAFAEHTDRVLPSGTGIMRMPMKQGGSPVSPQAYRHELQGAIAALELALHPNDQYRQDLAKFEKRRRDRAELVDAAAKAFHVTWEGRETVGSRNLTKLLLIPDPAYKPSSRLTSIFGHVRATLWVDESAGQIVRTEAGITSDVDFGGGIVARIFHGGRFVMEKSEVAPGIWMPTLLSYDFDGRKFLFGFGVHDRTEITNYRRVGPPAEAIELLRVELNNLVAGVPAP